MWRDAGAVVFNGPDEQFISGRMIGADGGIGGTYAVMPELFLAADEALKAGNIQRAKEILADLEHHAPKIHMREVAEAEEEPQITMSDLNENAVTQRLRGMQIETMTPIEAMNALFELKKLV